VYVYITLVFKNRMIMDRQSIIDLVNSNRCNKSFLEEQLVNRAKSGESFAVSLLLPHIDPYSNAYSVLVNASNTEIIDMMLQSLNYSIPRGLNVILQDIRELDKLEHLLNHPRARFNVGYRQYSCVRTAIVNGDIKRVNVFLNYSTVNIHIAGNNTMDKTCVELAVELNYTEILYLFIARGLTVTHPGYSDNVNKHILIAQICYEQKVLAAIKKLMTEYILNNCKIPYDYMYTSNVMSHIFPYELHGIKLMGKISSLLDRMDDM